MAARVSGLSWMPALALAWTCSGREAPTIADATSGRAQHRQRQFGHRQARLVGDRPQAVHGLQDRVVQQAIHRHVHVAVGRARVGGGLPRAVLAGQHALRQWRPDDLGDAVGTQREQLDLGRPPEHRVLGLGGDEQVRPGEVDRRLDLLGRPLAEAQVACLA